MKRDSKGEGGGGSGCLCVSLIAENLSNEVRPVYPYRWKIVHSREKSIELTFKCVEYSQSSVLCIISFDLGTV